jgi:hypothetical protein
MFCLCGTQAVLHPTAPLFSSQQQTLKPLCIAALKRIFLMCDKDKVRSLPRIADIAVRGRNLTAPVPEPNVDC